MLNKATVQSAEVRKEKGTSKKSGKPYLFWVQKIWIHCPNMPFPKEEERMIWPVKGADPMSIPEPTPSEPPLPVGEYNVTVYIEDINREGKPLYKTVYKNVNEK